MASLETRRDDFTEVASTWSAQATDDGPALENYLDETPANEVQNLSAQKIRSPAMAGKPVSFSAISEDSPQRIFQNDFGSSNSGFQVGQIHGPVNVQYNTEFQGGNESLFDNLVLREDRFAGQHAAKFKKLKARHRSARLSTTEAESADSYAPYVIVRDRNIKAHLCHIAKLFQYIDHGFAEYFKVVVSRLPRSTVQGYLESARNKVKRKQTLSQHTDHTDPSVNLGDLGNFCEKILDRQSTPEAACALYEITDCTQEDLLHYLQDAFEVPYWQIMLELFLQQNANSRSLSANVVFRVLSSFKMEVLQRRDVIQRDLKSSEKSRVGDIEPLTRGIDARIAVLEDAWHKDISDLEACGPFQALFSSLETDHSSTSLEEIPATSVKVFSAWPTSQESSQKDTIIYIALIALFVIASLIPGYLAFSIAIGTPGIGSTSDADFWNLLQSSVIAVLGSLMTMVPLLRDSWFTAAHTVTWVLWGSGFACAVTSVGIYPVCNPAYSSAVSYFGSVFSLMAVLAATQVVPKPDVTNTDKDK